MTTKIRKDTIHIDDLKTNYMTVASIPNIKSIEPHIYYDNFLKNYTLDLNVKTKNTLVAKIGGVLSTDPISNMFIGTEYNFLQRYAYKIRTNGYFGRYYSAINSSFLMDFPNKMSPFHAEIQVNLNRWNYFRNRSGLFEYSATNYIVQRESNVQLKIGMPVTKKSKLEIKTGIGETNDKYFNNTAILSTDTSDITRFKNWVTGGCFELNTLNSDIYATHGRNIKISIQYIYGNEHFTPGNTYSNNTLFSPFHNITYKKHSWLQFDLQTKEFHSVTQRYTLGFLTQIHYSFQDLFFTQKASLLNSTSFAPTMETFTRFYPEYRANQFFGAGLEQIFKIGESFLGSSHVRGGIYGFIPVREILANDYNQPYYGEMFKQFYVIGALSFVSVTPLGNIVLSASYTQRENTNLIISTFFIRNNL